MRHHLSVVLAALFLVVRPVSAQPLPTVNGVEWPHLRDHCRELLRGIDEGNSPVPADTVRVLREMLAKEPGDPEVAVMAVQRLLAPYCLVGVDVNPESRVKATRGAASAELPLGRKVAVLI